MSKIYEGLRPEFYYDSILTDKDRKDIEKEEKKFKKREQKKNEKERRK